MAVGKPNNYADIDGNWQWPEKTWFRERLNAIKAQEVGRRRRLGPSAPQSVTDAPAAPTEAEALKLD